MIEILFDLEQDFKKNSYFYKDQLNKKFSEYLTTTRFGNTLKKKFNNLEDYIDWKESIIGPYLKRKGQYFQDEEDSLDELDEFDNYSEDICGISWPTSFFGKWLIQNFNAEIYNFDFILLPQMTVIRFLNKTSKKAEIKIKLVGDISKQTQINNFSYYNISTWFQRYFLGLFWTEGEGDRSMTWPIMFEIGTNPLSRIFHREIKINEKKDVSDPDYGLEGSFLPIFQEILGKLLIEAIVYDYYRRKKNAEN
jgi:hypothetical protein